jgi:RNA polymerase sigma-70 factor (ECF subfamily)
MTGDQTPATPDGWTRMYVELKGAARSCLRREPYELTLSATGLVHEAWLRLAGERRTPFENQRQYVGAAVQTMRRVLIDRARRRVTDKRRGIHVTLTVVDAAPLPFTTDDERLLDVDAALEKLAAVDERLVRVVECRYFAGLTIEETAEALGVSDTTVCDDWRFARAWLRRVLGPTPPAGLAADAT